MLQQPWCHDDERSALLQFKESFVIDKSASAYEGAYPKFLSWKPEGESSNCCSWDGIQCDEKTSYVIGLDLSSSCLFGSINSTSSLFSLLHLRTLNLADNNFKYSPIPTEIGKLSMLRYLNLSSSAFFGQIPSQISSLSKLSSLDLSLNLDGFTGTSLLQLKKPNFASLVQNLTKLEKLDLSSVNVSSTVADSLANFSSITSLLLEGCGLHGDFPATIFQLPNLRSLSVRENLDLNGFLPEFNQSSSLMFLSLAGTNFSGNLPSSMENLHSLVGFVASKCNFEGPIPSSIGKLRHLLYLDLSDNNLVGQIPESIEDLTQLSYLALSFNGFSGGNLSWVGKQSRLTILDLASTNLTGEIPSSLQNLTQLTELYLDGNQIAGFIPSWIGNLTQLTKLFLRVNNLIGPIPEPLFGLKNLETIFLDENALSGIVKFDMFLSLKDLTYLRLNSNNLSLLIEPRSTNATLPKFKVLALALCNISEFPDFLRYQDQLAWLELFGNNIHGQIPKWVLNTSTETLKFLGLSNNFLTGFDQLPDVLPWTNVQMLRLSNNMLQGPLPIPPPSTIEYDISDNLLTGEISPMICNLSDLQMLSLYNNKLSGTLPQCLGNFSKSLMILQLGNNSFRGSIPQTCSSGSNLRMMKLNSNQFQGKLPRSLVNCVMLESLDLTNNELTDVFPSWLGTLSELKLLLLHGNRFYGEIGRPKRDTDFPKLRVIDLSYNNFTGNLPADYWSSWSSMKEANVNHSDYMTAQTSFLMLNKMFSVTVSYEFSITITNKGVERYYQAILEEFAVIDLSSNRFEGDIPEVIGNLQALHFLNLSNNFLTGVIPPSLGNLTELESLDFSQNQLRGEIPHQLVQLTFLSSFNVSYNNLTGPIPQGNQLDTFDSTSYEGNPGLCGKPSSRKCNNAQASPLPPTTFDEDDKSGSSIKFDWRIVLSGFIGGLVVGVVLSDFVTMRLVRWLVIRLETLGWTLPKRRRRISRRNRV
ncbi:hypothetical protein FNV43_RR18378 [Rhamnella rubrinervis]|uniref:Leucine-rich repeat-containing N-terminal plant-type domain-containing protein n=1 Tax=Rhamnella rubrinervis TaxID=2594499 RepID=A0A8K0E661_9ROSA|nr:hypothetical protein FNV43_RR18378 [Rhamnella rubrinervis]